MDVGLYVHVPFCTTKCGYCDFYSKVPAAGETAPLVDALLRELETALTPDHARVATLFVGGGTPTVLPDGQFHRLFDRLRVEAARRPSIEFSVEANPGSLTDVNADILRAAGVNRISIGAQSFHRRELRVLDRIHEPADVPLAAEIVRRAGFEHFNLDLIFGVPGQTPASWTDSLRRAVALGPDHLACYGLTYEPGTPLRERQVAGRVEPMDTDLEADLYEITLDVLAGAGFEPYEISNFARPGGRSAHNLRYWRNEPTIGVGPSAASYLAGRRWRNVPDTQAYVRGVLAGQDVTCDHETLDPDARAGETVMLGLRLTEGISRRRFRAATGFELDARFGPLIVRHVAAGLLTADRDRIALTHRGRLLADTILADFLTPASA